MNRSNFKQHKVIQGTQEWLDLRSKYFTASEAQAMMGASAFGETRQKLLRQKATGETDEVSPSQQHVYDDGHNKEALARPHVEKIIGYELYPVTLSCDVDELPLLASLDGAAISNDTMELMLDMPLFEHKGWKQSLAEAVKSNDVPETYYWQLEHQLLVSGADKVLFVTSDGTPENMEYTEYTSNPERRQSLIDGWRQFAIDLANYTPEYTPEKPEAKALMELPALNIAVTGKVTESNLALYKETALAFIENINTDLQTDQDFADAESTVKFCKNAETELDRVKKRALSQTEEIDLLFKTVDHLREELRSKRLNLDRQVKDQKALIRANIQKGGECEIDKHITQLNASLNPFRMPAIAPDFGGAMKGKKTITSLRDAVADVVAKTKIELNRIADLMRSNIKLLQDEGGKYPSLFHDAPQLVMYETDKLEMVIKVRIADHQKAIAEAEQRAAAKAKAEAERAAESARLEAERAAEIKQEKQPGTQEPENPPSEKPKVRMTATGKPVMLFAVPSSNGFDLVFDEKVVGHIDDSVLQNRESITIFRRQQSAA